MNTICDKDVADLYLQVLYNVLNTWVACVQVYTSTLLILMGSFFLALVVPVHSANGNYLGPILICLESRKIKQGKIEI